MANVNIGPGGGGSTVAKDIATDTIAAVEHQLVKVEFGAAGAATQVSAAAPLPVVPATEQAGVGVGAAADAEAAANGSVIGILKRLRTLLNGGLPAALGAGGGVKVDGSGTALPVSIAATVTVDTELPAAAALTDAFANPTAPAVADFIMGWNGATWDRLKSTPANGLVVDVSRVQGTVTVGSHAVTNAGTFAVQDSEKVADNAAFTDGTTKVQPAGYIFDEVAGTALTENDAAAARIDAKRAQIGVIEDATTRGQRAAVSAAGRLAVDASGVAVPVTDNAGSLTVDAPVGTPVFVRLSDGTAAIATLPVSIAATVTVDTELPAAAALADAAANPTSPMVAGANLVYNGATWDRARGDIANGLDVDVTRLPALVTGAALVGRVSLDPQTANGLSISRVISNASTNGTSVKASAGQVYTIIATNINAAVRYLKLYNKASAPTVGTDTPVLTIAIPGNAAGAGIVIDTGGIGAEFATGIALALTTGAADSDTGAVAANEIICQLLYK